MKTQTSQSENQIERSLWANAFPHQFPFYHLGSVEIETSAPAQQMNEILLTEYFPLCFSFQGELKGLMILLLEKDLDLSLYSELGNILASTIANEISIQNDLDVMISPPYSLSHDRLKSTIEECEKKIIRRVYNHIHNGQNVRVEALMLPSDNLAEVGHA